jgi:coenzyme PQQ precursor peptide PqqA
MGEQRTVTPHCIGGRVWFVMSNKTVKQGRCAMGWTTPTLIEICVGLEINGYLPAEF